MQMLKLSLVLSSLLSMICSNSVLAKEWVFTAKLDGQKIGQHSFTLTESAEGKKMLSQANFKVKVLFINAYNYAHTANESWNGNCLTSIKSHTEENKEITDIQGSLNGSSFEVQSPKGNLKLPECVMTFTYWNPVMLQQSKLLNPQTGEWLESTITKVGNETIIVRGKKTATEHYRLTAPKMKIDLWYTQNEANDKDWVALKSTTPEGYVISYELQ